MSIYNYHDALKRDINKYFDNHGIGFTLDVGYMMKHYYAELFSSSVTGLPDGFYTDRLQAAHNLAGNFPLISAALRAFYGSTVPVSVLSPEHLDMLIRCYLLQPAMREVFEDIEAKFEAEGLPWVDPS